MCYKWVALTTKLCDVAIKDYTIPSLAKACQILSWLADQSAGCNVSEVARRHAMARTTAFRVLRTLCSEGYVEEADGKYRLGSGLIRLGLRATQSTDMYALAQPIVDDLCHATGETAHLAVRSGNQMVIVHVVESPNPIRVSSRSGALVLIHCAATGKAMLSTLTPEDVRHALAGEVLVRRTDKTLTTLDALEIELATTRERGYAIDDEEYHPGVRCLAAPVWDPRGGAVAAIGITGATSRIPKKSVAALAKHVCHAARSLSLKLGAP